MKKENPVADFEQFVMNGQYNSLKQHESFLKQAKGHLEKELRDSSEKRHVFPEQNMVAKFVAKEIRTTNHEGLIGDLFDYIMPDKALPLMTLDDKRMKDDNVTEDAASFLLPRTYHIRPYLNKAGKLYVRKYDYLFGGQTSNELVAEIQSVNKLYKECNNEYDLIKQRIFARPQLFKGNKVTTPIGSISKIPNKPTWNMNEVLHTLGEEFLQTYGKVDLTKLDEWVLMGRIPKAIVRNNRELVDIQLTFTVMNLDDEERILNVYHNKRTNLSLRKYA